MNLRQQQALHLLQSGLSIIPIRPDGTKAPTVKWQRYQAMPASVEEVQHWFASMHSGIGIIGGHVSGDLEILDFDDTEVFQPWLNLVNQVYEHITDALPIVQTPTNGRHVYYRAHAIEGNQKLARQKTADGTVKVRIETRGEGGYVLSPYCHPNCHSLQRPYVLLRGELAHTPLISQIAREVMLNCAKAFDEVVEPLKPRPQRSSSPDGERPGDVFNATHTWEDILLPAGWSKAGQRGTTEYWKRPDKRERGWSASTNHDGHELLYVFTTNSHPFEANRGYSKFTAFTLLNFDGDFHAAAKAVMKGR